MKVETEMDAGSAGYFLIDNQVALLNIEQVRVNQDARYAGARPGEPVVEYLVCLPNSLGDKTWVPAKRAAQTKEALLKKL